MGKPTKNRLLPPPVRLYFIPGVSQISEIPYFVEWTCRGHGLSTLADMFGALLVGQISSHPGLCQANHWHFLGLSNSHASDTVSDRAALRQRYRFESHMPQVSLLLVVGLHNSVQSARLSSPTLQTHISEIKLSNCHNCSTALPSFHFKSFQKHTVVYCSFNLKYICSHTTIFSLLLKNRAKFQFNLPQSCTNFWPCLGTGIEANGLMLTLLN